MRTIIEVDDSQLVVCLHGQVAHGLLDIEGSLQRIGILTHERQLRTHNNRNTFGGGGVVGGSFDGGGLDGGGADGGGLVTYIRSVKMWSAVLNMAAALC